MLSKPKSGETTPQRDRLPVMMLRRTALALTVAAAALVSAAPAQAAMTVPPSVCSWPTGACVGTPTPRGPIVRPGLRPAVLPGLRPAVPRLHR